MDILTIILLILEAGTAFLLLKRTGALKTAGEAVLSALLIAAAFALRAAFFDYETTDYQWFLTRWVDYYRNNGGFAALKDPLGNYNIPYLYFLALFSMLPSKDLYLIKLLSTFFDVVLAAACAKLVRAAGGSSRQRLVCFLVILFLPTAVINGSVWGQCDSIYVSLALLGLAIGIGEPEAYGRQEQILGKKKERLRPILSMACIAASFGFKLQAVFLMPAWVILWVRKKYRWTDFAVFPLTYLLMILPAVLLGRPFSDALLLYADQANTVGTALNYNSPSMTAFLHREVNTQTVSAICIALAFLAMILLLILGIRFRDRLSGERMTAFTLLLALTIPFFLPHMHDRYFFAADCLTVAFACMAAEPSGAVLRSFSAVLMQFASLICYLAYLRTYYLRIGRVFLTADRGALAVVFCMLITAGCLAASLQRAETRKQKHRR